MEPFTVLLLIGAGLYFINQKRKTEAPIAPGDLYAQAASGVPPVYAAPEIPQAQTSAPPPLDPVETAPISDVSETVEAYAQNVETADYAAIIAALADLPMSELVARFNTATLQRYNLYVEKWQARALTVAPNMPPTITGFELYSIAVPKEGGAYTIYFSHGSPATRIVNRSAFAGEVFSAEYLLDEARGG